MPRFGIPNRPDPRSLHLHDERANRNVDILREFASEQGIKYFYDITDRANFKAPDYRRLPHRPEEVTTALGKFCLVPILTPAMLVLQFATGIGNTDAGFIMGTGKLLIKVPATMRFVLDGEMPSSCWRRISFCKLLGMVLLGRIEQWNLLGKPFRN